VAAGHEQCLHKLDELAAKKLKMLINGLDESASGQVGDNKVDVVDIVSVHMGGLERESAGGDGEEEDESDGIKDDDKLVEKDSPKSKVKDKGCVNEQAKEQTSHMTSLLIKKVRQGKASSYQTAESFKVCCIPSAR
jgi:hypothetical protein